MNWDEALLHRSHRSYQPASLVPHHLYSDVAFAQSKIIWEWENTNIRNQSYFPDSKFPIVG